jgi:hypothetical protein
MIYTNSWQLISQFLDSCKQVQHVLMFQSANYRDRGISGQFGLSLCSPFTPGSSGSQEIIDFFLIGTTCKLQSLTLPIPLKSKFQMDTFDSFWEIDSDKKLNRPRRWRWRRSDNSSTFFLRKVELKIKSKNHLPIFSSYQKC